MAMMENRRGELTDLLLREGGVGGRKGNLCSGQVSRVCGVTENLPILPLSSLQAEKRGKFRQYSAICLDGLDKAIMGLEACSRLI